MFAVVLISLWPSHSWICFIGTSFARRSDAQLCLRSWKRIWRRPLRSKILLKFSVTAFGLIMLPAVIFAVVTVPADLHILFLLLFEFQKLFSEIADQRERAQTWFCFCPVCLNDRIFAIHFDRRSHSASKTKSEKCKFSVNNNSSQGVEHENTKNIRFDRFIVRKKEAFPASVGKASQSSYRKRSKKNTVHSNSQTIRNTLIPLPFDSVRRLVVFQSIPDPAPLARL